MEIKPAGNIPYTEKQFNDYKERLARTLMDKALDSDSIFMDTEAKQFITNYVETELLSEQKDMERLILNLNIRLANIDINTSTGTKNYPVINEYKIHHLVKTYYFYRDTETKSIKLGTVEVKKSPLII